MIINRFSYLADNLFSYGYCVYYVHLAVFAKCVILYEKQKNLCDEVTPVILTE